MTTRGKRGSIVVRLFAAVIVLTAAAVGGYFAWQQYGGGSQQTYQTVAEAESKYVRLDMEAYDAITEHYWQEVEDAALAGLYQQSLAKAMNVESVPLATTTRGGVADMLHEAFAQVEGEEAKKELALRTIAVVLYNLAPQGRSQFFTQQQETELRNEVANINPENDLYADLGIEKGASIALVQEAYESRRAALESSTSTDAVAELARVVYAHEVLAATSTKELYDTNQVEPTVSSKMYGDDTLYANFAQIAPTSLKEFVDQIVLQTQEHTPTNLIVDLRGNVGGALDFAPYFLGVFIGPNQYAADLFSKGEREAMRTPPNIPAITELAQFNEIVFLVDERTQSTAELVTAIFKRQNLATIVGAKTKGWGTVENTFPLETELTPGETYVLYLVHSLTLRDDQQPVEGNGVVPHVSITEDDWESKLSAYIDAPSLRAAVGEVIGASQ